MSKLGLIILAGGLSSRMARPKALLPWTNGESLISHALRNALEHDIDDILISVGTDEVLAQEIQHNIIDTLSNEESQRVSIVRDSVERSGPLGGLYSSLSVGRSEAYALLAVDMPFMDISLYYEWLYEVDEPWDAIIPSIVDADTTLNDQRCLEPMAGIYKTAVKDVLPHALASEDMSLRGFINMLHKVSVIDANHCKKALRNVNYYDEYKWARAEAVNKERQVPVLSIVAKHRKTGKTTVVTKLVETLSEKGIAVGVVKSDSHGFQMDHEGTDTDTAYNAGACAVAIAGPTETAVRLRTEQQMDVYHLTQQLPVDIVLLETRSQGVFPSIEVVVDPEQADLISTEDERICTVALATLDETLPHIVGHIEKMVRR
ncbi:molybdopterin-guanine dinucleotide biosynthesis protein MobB [Veillonella agrestimuris]|uniref:molybdopterin-guanine dinucleotide biosynthesis protein MobB n=1 Tax=Veillonella agrestimuris TaxID=2941340 RepID=UPI0020400534|nr:molybdopterin-guanine dinucleotide biosynthesis protein MobB [Veillonella agrestimuris]